MAFDVSALTNYVRERTETLVASSVLSPKTAGLIKSKGNVLTGIKSSEKINIYDTDVVFQDGSACGFTTSGTTTFTQRTLSVGKIKINESLCPKDLETKYTQQALTSGSRYDTIAFADWYTQRKVDKIADALETSIWKGDTASGTANLQRFDGLQKLILADANTVNANSATFYGTPATTIDATNVVAVFDAIYKAIPAALVDKDDLAIFCGMDIFRLYTIKLKDLNMFNYNYQVAANTEFILPGTNIKVIATPGLNGTNDQYAMRLSNLYIGTDMMNEEEKFELFYAKEADQVRFVSEFKFGVQYAFGSEIVRFVI